MTDHMPDPDAVEVRIGCERDAEAEECHECNTCQHHAVDMRFEPCATCVTNVYSKTYPHGTNPENDRWAPRIATQAVDTDTSRGTCPTCGGAPDERRHRHPSPHIWSGRTWAGDECMSQKKREYCTHPCHGTGVK